MNILKKACTTLLAMTAMVSVSCTATKNVNESATNDDSKVVVAYVTSWTDVIPDPTLMTHINYAFGHVSESFDGVGIHNPDRLKEIVALKEANPDLKVLLSIGGWGSGRFSEMAADSTLRASFAADSRRVVDEYGLDGIDIDWEYPTQSSSGISSSPDDTDNFTLLMRDIRSAIGADKLLTLATVASGEYIDFKSILPYIDFVNVMSYDMGNAPLHHSAIYPSENTGRMTAHTAINSHIMAGVPPTKLVLGIPFYGRGAGDYSGYQNFRDFEVKDGYEAKWDSVAASPYIADAEGRLVLGYESPESAKLKCDYVIDNDLKGVMYWEYSGDDDNKTLATLLADNIIGKTGNRRVLVLNEGGGQHGPFTAAGMKWLREKGKEHNFTVTEIHNASPITKRFLEDYDLIIQLDFPPYTWPEAAQQAFIEYIDEGLGNWIGFHHATLLGDFDGYPMWDWFSDFMGGIRFQNYIAPLADGTVVVEESTHPVMKGLDNSFVLPDDEWYTYNVSPRAKVKVLASVDENSYTPASDIKMGDHPVVWTNPDKKAKNIYIQMGHSPKLFDSSSFTTLFENSLMWCLE